MDSREVWERLPSMTAVDLNDYNDHRLSEAGELEVTHYVEHDIYLKLGGDLLELSKISLTEGHPTLDRLVLDHEAKNAYVLRNLTADRSDAAVLLDDRTKDIGRAAIGSLDLAVLGREKLTVGRAPDATPELRLSDTVSRKHLSLRLGGMRGNLHFADLDSWNGTTVFLDPEDGKKLSYQRRTFKIEEDGTVDTTEQLNQRWSR